VTWAVKAYLKNGFELTVLALRARPAAEPERLATNGEEKQS
jgi:hypothetical protein